VTYASVPAGGIVVLAGLGGEKAGSPNWVRFEEPSPNTSV